MIGYSAHDNALGFRAVRLHYTADPDKNPHHEDPDLAEKAQQWYDSARGKYPDPNQWAQEMEINWWVAQGQLVYPEFQETLHAPALDGFRARKIIYRAWDFGWHAPACLIAQIDSKDRLVILKEVVGRQETTREFARDVIKRCADWFPRHTAGFQDFCDPAGQQATATANERSEVRDVEILNKLGVFPSWAYGWSRKDGRALVHQLLQIRLDHTPSMFVNGPDCPVLLQGFLGKYVYPPKKNGAAHDEPDEGNHPWADVMACLRYLATGLYSALGLRRGTAPDAAIRKAPAYMGYGTPIKREPSGRRR